MHRHSLSCLGKMIMIVLSMILHFTESRDCMDSLSFMNITQKCPRSKDEWKKAAADMDCINKNQNCVERNKFVYHCVPDQTQRQFVAVCAPKYFIIGQRCPEFNLYGARIQSRIYTKCNECPFVYDSDTSYKYQECYILTDENTPESTLKSTTTYHSVKKSETNGPILTVCITGAGILLLGVLSAYLVNKTMVINRRWDISDHTVTKEAGEEILLESINNLTKTGQEKSGFFTGMEQQCVYISNVQWNVHSSEGSNKIILGTTVTSEDHLLKIYEKAISTKQEMTKNGGTTCVIIVGENIKNDDFLGVKRWLVERIPDLEKCDVNLVNFDLLVQQA